MPVLQKNSTALKELSQNMFLRNNQIIITDHNKNLKIRTLLKSTPLVLFSLSFLKIKLKRKKDQTAQTKQQQKQWTEMFINYEKHKIKLIIIWQTLKRGSGRGNNN